MQYADYYKNYATGGRSRLEVVGVGSNSKLKGTERKMNSISPRALLMPNVTGQSIKPTKTHYAEFPNMNKQQIN